MTVYKLYASSVAAGDGIATTDVALPGRIMGVLFVTRFTLAAGGIGRGLIELSFASSNGFAVNDTRGAIAQGGYPTFNVANGEGVAATYVPLPGVPVNAGERLHLHHHIGTAPSSALHSCFVYVDDKGGASGRLRQ